jgi:ribonuclease HII
MRLENSLRREGATLICGIDEVGRGCLAGPLVAGAVVLPSSWRGRLRDSKLLTKSARKWLSEQIIRKSLGYSLGWVDNCEIDELGVTQAITLAYERALEALELDVSLIVIDGNYNYLSEYGIAQTLVKADQKVNCVAAASIIAKVARDEFMTKLSTKYPEYCFNSNMGYATKAHQKAIRKFGLTDIHRKSFCRNFV